LVLVVEVQAEALSIPTVGMVEPGHVIQQEAAERLEVVPPTQQWQRLVHLANLVAEMVAAVAHLTMVEL
jgi:hypothetical protein